MALRGPQTVVLDHLFGGSRGGTHKGWKWGRSGVLQTPYFIERRSAKIGKSSSGRFQKQGNHRADFQESASGSRLFTEILLWPRERRPSGFTFPYKTPAKPLNF